MKMEDTVIEQGGVLRCCLASVALEYEGKEIELGEKSECPYCHQGFTLVQRTGPKPVWWTDEQWARPVWRPDWKLITK